VAQRGKGGRAITQRHASDPISLVAADIHQGLGQRASPPAGLKFIIQNMCQLGAAQKI
jgi:hypothetical protein